MKKALLKAIILLTAASVMLSSLALVGYADMAFNIYANPVTSGTSGIYDTFTIDFRSGMTPDYTYWALANFGLYFSRDTLKKYDSLSGGGAYAGLQQRSPTQGRAGIMSFWEMTYRERNEKITFTATRVYPSGQSTFGGEGEGTNIIEKYDWENDKWYRMVLHSWTDAETGTTFVGQWFQDIESGKWTLFSYFDTHLINSAIKGGMGLFQENYVGTTWDQTREFNTKNIYVLDHEDQQWKSLSTVEISYGDGGAANKKGAHEFGATEEYFWGKSGGAVDDQASYDAASTQKETFTINQPDAPTFGDPSVSQITISAGAASDHSVNWSCLDTGTPQLSYDLEVFGVDGTSLFKKVATRPHVVSCDLEGVTTDAFKCVLTVTDIFGKQTTVETETKAYTEASNHVSPTPSESPNEPSQPSVAPSPSQISPSTDDTTENEPNRIPLIVGVCCGVAVVVVGGVAVGVSIGQKKKKNKR